MSAEIAYERHRLISGRGGATISVKEDAVILNDVGQGVALYKLSGPERVKTFPVPCEILRSRNVSFHDGGSSILSGSDHGKVYIFDRRTGDIHDIIDMGIHDWVQSVTVRIEFSMPKTRLSVLTGSGGSRYPNDNHGTIRRKHRTDIDTSLGEGRCTGVEETYKESHS